MVRSGSRDMRHPLRVPFRFARRTNFAEEKSQKTDESPNSAGPQVFAQEFGPFLAILVSNATGARTMSDRSAARPRPAGACPRRSPPSRTES
jgi:hypothetical protein